MKRFRFILPLMLLMTVAQVMGAQSHNLLENGSFELPVADGKAIPTPIVGGWSISGSYWAIMTADSGGVSPIPDGYNELYLYIATATQQVCKMADNCNYKFSLQVCGNNLSDPPSSYAVMEAVSPDGARVFQLAKTYFSAVQTAWVWYTFSLSYNNLPGSMFSGYTGYTLRVRIYASGMLNIDNAVLTVTTDQIVIDDFESYTNQQGLQNNWDPQKGGTVSLENEFQNRFLGQQSMEFGYTYSANGFSEVEYDMANCLFGNNLQQGLSGQLVLSCCGNQVNSQGGQLYLRLEDSNENTLTIYSNNDLADEDWQLWVIDINDFSIAGVNTNDVSKLILGVRDTQHTAGSGVVYIDNIELPAQRIIGFNADINGDGIVNYKDLYVLLQNWLVAY